MAQNEMRAMRGMPQCVRLNEGLGVTAGGPDLYHLGGESMTDGLATACE